ncbi:MAG: FlgO family outer membrane protein [bacterium]
MNAFILFLAACLLCPCWCMAGSYEQAARNIAFTAAKKFKKRIAVLSFYSENGRKTKAGSIVSERLASHLAAQDQVEVVERSSLNEILKEQGLQSSGIMDGRTVSAIGSILGVEAIVTGTVIDLGNGNVELNARLVDTQSARVLSAVNSSMKKDWEDSPWQDMETPTEEFVPSAPLLRTEAKESGYCRKAMEQSALLLEKTIEVRARALAIRMRNNRLDMRTVTQNPGSGIADPVLRDRFYAFLKKWYYTSDIPRITRQEEILLDTSDLLSGQLDSLCNPEIPNPRIRTNFSTVARRFIGAVIESPMNRATTPVW